MSSKVLSELELKDQKCLFFVEGKEQIITLPSSTDNTSITRVLRHP